MKVILLQDIAQIGRRFEIKQVPDGHALNFLIPRKLAEMATRENLKRLEERRGKIALIAEDADKSLETLLDTLSTNPVTFVAPANEQGHLFKGIKAADISAQVSVGKALLPADAIKLDVPIKEIGDHVIMVMSGGREHTFILSVIKE